MTRIEVYQELKQRVDQLKQLLEQSSPGSRPWCDMVANAVKGISELQIEPPSDKPFRSKEEAAAFREPPTQQPKKRIGHSKGHIQKRRAR